MIELGKIDIIIKVSLWLSHVALPRERHLEAAIHVMAHVSERYNSRLMNDPLYPEIDHSAFRKCDWSEFYWDGKEAIPILPQNLEVRRLKPTCLWIVITQGTKCLAD